MSDELEGLQPTEGFSVEDVGDAGSTSEKIRIGDKEYSYEEINEAFEALKNKKQWQAENTRRSQELAEYKRQLDGWAQSEWQKIQKAYQEGGVQAGRSQVDETIGEIEELYPDGGKAIKTLLDKIANLESNLKKHTEWIHALASYESQGAKKSLINGIMSKYQVNSETLRKVLEKAYDSGSQPNELEELAKGYVSEIKSGVKTYIDQKKTQSQKPRVITSSLGGSASVSPSFTDKFKDGKQARNWMKSQEASKALKEFIDQYKNQ